MSQLALITSTIAPATGTHLLARADPAQRLLDYQQGFAFYCDRLREGVFDAISYVDNSGYPLDSLRQIARAKGVETRVEFISYRSDLNPGNGRFYLEIRLIEHFMRQSMLLRELDEPQVWKLSGRYRIANIAALVRSCVDGGRHDLCINCRNHPLRWADFYVAAFTSAGWRRLFADRLSRYEGPVDGERILRDQLEGSDLTGIRVSRRFKVVPRIEGVRGIDGARYHGARERVKYWVRCVLNRIAPSLWI
jgi:hypothetical protein